MKKLQNGRKGFKNLNKKKKALVIISGVLVLALGVSIPLGMKVMTSDSVDTKKVESKNVVKKTTKKDTKKDTKETEKEEELESSEEEKDNPETQEETTSESTTSNTTTNSNSGSNNSGNITQNRTQPQTQPVQSQPVVTQAPVREQTAWEKLGISEYEYYNATNDGELAFAGSDLSVCENEVKRIVNSYYRSGVTGGNSYTVSAKYTGQYKGCGLKLRINGVEYSYSQARSILGF